MYKQKSGWSIGEVLFQWIVDNIKKGDTIVELGSGEATKELAKRYDVYSIEHDPIWMDNAKKAHYIYAPIKRGWYDPRPIKKGLPKEYSLLLVDGPPGGIGREGILKYINLFRDDIPIIIDDLHRRPEQEIFEELVKRYNDDGYVSRDGNKMFGVINAG